jgi:sulfur carrier protein
MDIFVNGKPHTCPADSTVADLIEQLELTGKRLAVERNQTLIPRSLHAMTRLQEGDRLEIVVAVGGG